MNRLRLSHHNLRTALRLLPITALAIIIAASLLFTYPPNTDAQPNASDAPRIAANGVQIMDAWNMDDTNWQAWLSRPPGDDTYGAGDLFVVGVTFTEPVSVDAATTFNLEVGWRNKTLVYAGATDNTVYFGTTVPQHWHDDDGVRIGDNTETLDHNPQGFIRHKTTGTPAVLTHTAPGILPNHKANGSISRPNVTRTEILRPSCDPAYLRDENVTVRVTFDQNVAVHGTPQAVLKIRGSDNQWRVRADYAEGAGTNAILLKYNVKSIDRETAGVRLDANAMLVKRDRGQMPLNNARVVGQNGGLMADLRTDGIARYQTASVDGSRRLATHCLTNLPASPASAIWNWTSPQPSATSYRATFTVNTDPGLGATHRNTTYIAGRMRLNGHVFVVAIINRIAHAQEDGRPTKAALCASWDQQVKQHTIPHSDGWVIVAPNVQGQPIVAVLPLDWTTGQYTMLIEQTSTAELGATYRCSIIETTTDPDTAATVRERHTVGTFFFHNQDGETPTIDPNFPTFGPGINYSGPDPVRPIDLPVFSVTAERPKLNNMRRPKFTTVVYSQPNPNADNGRVTYDESDGSVTLTAGGNTSHQDLNNNRVRYTYGSRR
ncbi:MAG: hypothetical protein OXE87_08590 [Chloroflexi bacterium]|nr:hypothetical protein [Chloroflexota bacterium]